jgi:hypothetical protein
MSATGKPLGRTGRNLLVGALVVVVLMAFRVSWNALRDVARAIGADDTASLLYPVVVDGLMALALIAALVLSGRERRLALRVLGTYTFASLVLNYVHGLMPGLHNGAVDLSRVSSSTAANWALVLLATSLPVGSIYFGSDLVAMVLHHRPETDVNAEEIDQIEGNRSTSDLVEAPAAAPVEEAPAPAPEAGPVEAAEAPAPLPARDPSWFAGPVGVPVRKSTGRVPEAARSPRPNRTPEELLDQARAVTAGWSVEELTAEAIRREVRTSPAKARVLREALRAERGAESPVPAEAVA